MNSNPDAIENDPDYKNLYYHMLKKLIETSVQNNEKKAYLICFSMGCVVSHYFLTTYILLH
mgnify:CR=1 FL=1